MSHCNIDLWSGALLTDGLAYPLPHPVVGPVPKEVLNRRRRPGRQIIGQHLPLVARMQKVQDGVHDFLQVADTWTAGPLPQAQRFQDRPVPVLRYNRRWRT